MSNNRQPNFTQIPNIFLDDMHKLTPPEFKILMVICRKTYGWHKQIDKIANSQLEEISGLSKNTVKKSILELIKKGYIIQHTKGKYKTISEYSVNTEGQEMTLKTEPEGQTVTNRGSRNDPTKETIQKKEEDKIKTADKSAFTEQIKEIIESGYIELTGEKLSWENKGGTYGKHIKSIIKQATDQAKWERVLPGKFNGTTDDRIIQIIREKAKILYRLCKSDEWYRKQGFTYTTLTTNWNKLTIPKAERPSVYVPPSAETLAEDERRHAECGF